MNNCNCKPIKKPPFPAMSAHFAHTLDDMEEKYVKIQFIEIAEPSGKLDNESLNRLILSRENKIVYINNIYSLTSINENIYTYISTKVKEENYLEFNKLVLNKDTGDYSISTIKSKDGETIENLSLEVANMKKNIDQINDDVKLISTKLEEKVEVSITRSPDDDENIILNIFK